MKFLVDQTWTTLLPTWMRAKGWTNAEFRSEVVALLVSSATVHQQQDQLEQLAGPRVGAQNVRDAIYQWLLPEIAIVTRYLQQYARQVCQHFI